MIFCISTGTMAVGCSWAFLLPMHHLGDLVGKDLFGLIELAALPLFHCFDGCRMQLGGNDQWANILGGIDLTRRVTGEEVYGMTFTLLTTKEGKKMGKTENGAVWLDPEKTSPYAFFQYWRNVADGQVNPAQNICPLVVPAQLHPTAMVPVEMQKIIALHNHIVQPAQ